MSTPAIDMSRTSSLLDAIADGKNFDEDAVELKTDEEVLPQSVDDEPEQTEEAAPAEEQEQEQEQELEQPVQAADTAQAPQYQATEPYIPPVRENASAILEQIQIERAALLKQVNDGEIELEEYHEKTGRLAEVDAEIKAEIRANKQWTEYAQYQDEQAKRSAYEIFKAVPENQPFANDKRLFSAFNAAFMELEADAGARAKGYGWMLEEAKRMTVDAFSAVLGVAQKSPDQAATASNTASNVTDIKAKAKAAIASAKQPTPMSLSDISGTPGAAATEFERLDQAGSGFDKIDALMALPPEKLEAWMNRRI